MLQCPMAGDPMQWPSLHVRIDRLRCMLLVTVVGLLVLHLLLFLKQPHFSLWALKSPRNSVGGGS